MGLYRLIRSWCILYSFVRIVVWDVRAATILLEVCQFVMVALEGFYLSRLGSKIHHQKVSEGNILSLCVFDGSWYRIDSQRDVQANILCWRVITYSETPQGWAFLRAYVPGTNWAINHLTDSDGWIIVFSNLITLNARRKLALPAGWYIVINIFYVPSFISCTDFFFFLQ